ncbi:MAG: hypothetical protein U0872_15300 [Planctomycetaceae bacterium]
MTNAVAEVAGQDQAGSELLDDIDLNLDGSHDGPIGEDAIGEANSVGDAERAADAAATAAESDGLDDSSESSNEIAALKAEIQRLTDELAVKNDLENQIAKSSKRVERLASHVENCESAVKEAKADLKGAEERYEQGLRELRSLIKDKGRGQQRLPLQGKENDPPTEMVPAEITGETGDAIPAEDSPKVADEHASSPISVLGQKEMIKLFGQDAWEAAKDREEPFGLAKGELETLEGAEIATIGDLENRMREDSWWHQKIKKFGEKKVAKLIESLRIWRGKFPMPSEG